MFFKPAISSVCHPVLNPNAPSNPLPVTPKSGGGQGLLIFGKGEVLNFFQTQIPFKPVKAQQ